jgi:hypothetical protein
MMQTARNLAAFCFLFCSPLLPVDGSVASEKVLNFDWEFGIIVFLFCSPLLPVDGSVASEKALNFDWEFRIIAAGRTTTI